MPPIPLTHHEIIGLIEPFSRFGFHVDLQASNRLERKLVFKPVEKRIDLPNTPVFSETLQLENIRADLYRLTRRLTCDCAPKAPLEARLVIEGEHLSKMLTRLNSIALERQFTSGDGYIIAKSYLLLNAQNDVHENASITPMILTQMSAQLDGLSVTFTAPTVKVDPEGLIELMPGAADLIKLPDDLLAVLGWDWGLLQPKGEGWKARLSLHGKEPQRTPKTELKVERMIAHVAQTLAETPAQFHERLTAARWVVVFRRSIPLLISILLIGGALTTSNLNIAEDSQLRMLVLNAPPVLLVGFFCMREIPSIEIPPFPRRSKAACWFKIAEPSSVSSSKML